MKTYRHHRCSIRLPGYDYSQSGAYFVTICTQDRATLFGSIQNGMIQFNDAGKMIEKWYWELGNKFADIQCDEMVVMPNHIHFIIINVGPHLVGADLRVCPNYPGEHGSGGEHINGGNNSGEHTGSPLHMVVQWYKTMTTNEYIRGVTSCNWPRFNKRVWQRNYYEHIIRNEQEYHRIAQYIVDNPARWNNDRLYTGARNILMESPAEYGVQPWMV